MKWQISQKEAKQGWLIYEAGLLSCVISFPLNLPHSSTTLPARLVDLVNGSWNCQWLLKLKIYGLKLALAQLIFVHNTGIFSSKTASVVFKRSPPHPHFLSGRVFKLPWQRTSQLINIQWTKYTVHKKKTKVNKGHHNRATSSQGWKCHQDRLAHWKKKTIWLRAFL